MLYNVQHPLQQLFVKDTDTTSQTPFSDTKGDNEGGKAIVSMDIEKDPSPPVSMASIESTSKETDSFNGLQDVPVSASEKLETQDTVEKHLNNESIKTQFQSDGKFLPNALQLAYKSAFIFACCLCYQTRAVECGCVCSWQQLFLYA